MHAFWTLCSWALVTVLIFVRQPSTRTSKIAAHCLHFLYACMVCILLQGVLQPRKLRSRQSLFYSSSTTNVSSLPMLLRSARGEAGSRNGPTAESSTALVNARPMEYSRHDEVCYEPPI